MKNERKYLVIAAILIAASVSACSAEENLKPAAPGGSTTLNSGGNVGTGGTSVTPGTGGTGGATVVIPTGGTTATLTGGNVGTGGTTYVYVCDLGQSRPCATANGTGYQICNSTRTGYDSCIVTVPNPTGTGGKPGTGGTTVVAAGGVTGTGGATCPPDGTIKKNPDGTEEICTPDASNPCQRGHFVMDKGAWKCVAFGPPACGAGGSPGTGGTTSTGGTTPVGTGGIVGTGGNPGTGGSMICGGLAPNQPYSCSCPVGYVNCTQTCEPQPNGTYVWSTCAGTLEGTCLASQVNLNQLCNCPSGYTNCTQTCQLLLATGTTGGGYFWSTCTGTPISNGTCTSAQQNTNQSCSCANGGTGSQTCMYSSSTSTYNWTPCSCGGSGSTYVNCTMTGSNVGNVVLSGDVVSNLYESELGTPTRICLVGDTNGGESAANQSDSNCRTYVPGTTYSWAGLAVTTSSATSRFTFIGSFGATSNSSVRWSNNRALIRGGYCGWNDTDQLYFRTTPL